MKKEELSFGNWILVNGRRCRVSSISYLVIQGEPLSLVVTYDDGETDIPTEKWQRIEPIPLTPEILEKNGFTAIEDSCENVEYYQDENVCWNMARETICVGEPDIDIFKCEYVHQLQNYLTLLGIDKEIEL